MGVSLCARRKIDDVTDDDLMAAAKEICVGKKVARSLLDELREAVPHALDDAEECLLASGLDEVEKMAERIRLDVQRRLRRV